MRVLTEAEARTVTVLLANAGADERERLRQAGIPRSTYHAARRRIYEEGWLQDRYIPDPRALGYPTITFAIGRPFADGSAAWEAKWAARTGVVGLWAGRATIFGVFVHASDRAAESDRQFFRDPSASARSVVLRAPPSPEQVPVYFDFEGAWVHLAGEPGSRGYPQGVGVPAGTDPELRSARERWAMAELIRRPFPAEAAGRPGHLVGAFGLPRAQIELLRRGVVRHRVLAVPGRLPAFRGRGMERWVLVTGELRSGIEPAALLGSLLTECHVFPFLFAHAEGQVLMGAVGGAGPPEPGGGELRRRAVLPTLQSALRSIEIFEEVADDLRPIVDHRYDRLVQAP